MEVTYFVGSISFNTSEQGLYDYFSQYGKVSSVRLIADRMTGKSKGFAFVTMDENNSIITNGANGSELDGRTIYINVERPSERREYSNRSGEFRTRGGIIRVDAPIILINRHINLELFKMIKENPRHIYEIDPRKFEQLIAQMIEGFGYEVELTKQTRDGGKDIIAKRRDMENESFYIECKRFIRRKVSVNIVREFHSVLMTASLNQGIIATSSHFTHDAKQLAERLKNNHGCEINMKDFNGVFNWIDIYLDRAENDSSSFVSQPILTFFK